MVEVTREWLESVSDDNGLTRGQQTLLNIWCHGTPYVGRQIPEYVAAFIEKCKGYRGEGVAYLRALRGLN